jgi:hypothetical protein
MAANTEIEERDDSAKKLEASLQMNNKQLLQQSADMFYLSHLCSSSFSVEKRTFAF